MEYKLQDLLFVLFSFVAHMNSTVRSVHFRNLASASGQRFSLKLLAMGKNLE